MSVEEHTGFEDRLDAFLDGELEGAEQARFARHLAACRRCRRAAALHRAARSGLEAAPVDRATGALRARLRDALEGADAMRGIASRRISGWIAGLGAAAGVALIVALALWGRGPDGPFGTRPQAGATVPMIHAALADYRRRMHGELPPMRTGGIAALAARLPFRLQPLHGRRLQLISAWRTTIRGEAAAALAYRYGDHVLVQYVVSEALFFRQPRVRQAVARNGRYVASVRGLHVLAWPAAGSGSLLVGDLGVRALQAARG